MANEYLRQLNENHPNGVGFNKSPLTMAWGTDLALIPLKESTEEYNKEVAQIIEALDIFCKENNISDKDKKDFSSETNHYSLK